MSAYFCLACRDTGEVLIDFPWGGGHLEPCPDCDVSSLGDQGRASLPPVVPPALPTGAALAAPAFFSPVLAGSESCSASNPLTGSRLGDGSPALSVPSLPAGELSGAAAAPVFSVSSRFDLVRLAFRRAYHAYRCSRSEGLSSHDAFLLAYNAAFYVLSEDRRLLAVDIAERAEFSWRWFRGDIGLSAMAVFVESDIPY
jgi:hypothetical protein